MADDAGNPVDMLQAAREKLVEQRREIAATLAREYNRQATPGARDTFRTIQATIEAIDDAIEDEEKLHPRQKKELREPTVENVGGYDAHRS